MADSIDDGQFRWDDSGSSDNDEQERPQRSLVLLRKRDRSQVSSSSSTASGEGESTGSTRAQRRRKEKRQRKAEAIKTLKHTIAGKSIATLYTDWSQDDISMFIAKHAKLVLRSPFLTPTDIPTSQIIQFAPGPSQPPILDALKSLAADRWERIFCQKHTKGRTVPRVVVLSLSAVRAAELFDQLKFTLFNGQQEGSSTAGQKRVKAGQHAVSEVRVAKLFGKHFKLEDQVKFLASTPVSVAVGTPNRVQQIFDADPKFLQKLEWVILDVQTNAKGFMIFDAIETSKPVFEFLFKTCQPSLSSGKLKIALY